MWRKFLGTLINPTLNVLAKRVSPLNLRSESLHLNLITIARSIAADKDFRILLPVDSDRTYIDPKSIKIGFFGNIANNAYNFTKCLNRLNHSAELVIQDGWFDNFLMNRPFWEDEKIKCNSFEDALAKESQWKTPVYVRRVAYDPYMQMKFQGRYSAISEVQSMYKEAFQIDIPEDKALLLAQHMGHWPYLLAMKRYDVIQFSGAPISLGIFCPKPYVVFPTGSDLFITPFQETLFGLLMRAGYRYAQQLLLCEINYPKYLNRLDPSLVYSFAPLMIDTDCYLSSDSLTISTIRNKWMNQVGGKKFMLNVCRQSWQWKGNDRLILSFCEFIKQSDRQDEWRIVFMQWGDDIDKSKQLIEDIGIGDKVLWEPLVSKPMLRDLQCASDLVVDQFVMQGYGTSVLESMALGKPVLIAPFEQGKNSMFDEKPPFIEATSTKEIQVALECCSNDNFLKEKGLQSLEWLYKNHGYRKVAEIYTSSYIASVIH
jgi:glycosyltransferase involved in cell wall biosynthesis